jgi:hypothetical protein
LPGNPPECLILRGKIRNFFTDHQQTHPDWRGGRNHVPLSNGIKKNPLEKWVLLTVLLFVSKMRWNSPVSNSKFEIFFQGYTPGPPLKGDGRGCV